ncbi:MAG: hypothetical protein EDX89_16125 [Acidobacteria bacterium]|nr:MAG: hypothetical protein EDX89_16125 [Acidobacteriota bacterium]MCE7960167.1 hypothetical protein [Acidobacteria bacterium ACB2]
MKRAAALLVPILLAATAGVLPVLRARAAERAVPTATLVPPSGSPTGVRLVEREGRLLLSVNDVVSALGGTVEYDPETGSYEVKLKEHSAVFGVETPLAVVDTRLVPLSATVVGEGTAALADPDFFVRVVGPMLGAAISWDRATRTLSARVTTAAEMAVEASVAAFESTTKVVLRLPEMPAFKVEKGEDQLLLRFEGVRLVAVPAERILGDERVSRLLVRGTDAVVGFRERGLSTNVYTLASPPRVVVEVTRPRPAPAVPLPLASPVPGATPTPPPIEPKTIVLDPGHGGSEEGAKGPGGLLEKDATLAIVKVIREVLTKRGYRVVTTRDSDVTVGLEDRAAQANAARADVFLSIHFNASRSPNANGTEVYYLSLDATDRAAAAVAQAENEPGAEPSATPSAETNAALRDLEMILWDLAQNQHLAASARLAEIVQADFNRLLGIETRGVKQAPFKVLIGVNATAVLVEVAFITNAEEEKKLASDEFRRQVAETLAGSLETYFRHADATAPVPVPAATPALR